MEPAEMAGIARRFHVSTKHSFTSVRQTRHVLDWSNKPSALKQYPRDLSRVPLPEPRHSGVDAMSAIRGELRGDGVTDLEAIARLLRYGAGVIRKQTYDGQTHYFRTYASAGALYPVELYVVCAELDGLPAGVYHFHPKEMALTRLRDGDHRGHLLRACGGHDSVATAPVLLVATGIPWRTCWKYQARGYRHLFWDAGTIVANLLALTASDGLPAALVTGFADHEVDALIGVDGQDEFTLCMVTVGEQGTVSPADEPPPPLGVSAEPLSDDAVRYPEAEEVHDAGRLGDPPAVAAWRRGSPRPAAGLEDADPPMESASDPDKSIEEVIRIRGSARRFGDAAMPAGQLHAVLSAAGAGVRSDMSDDLMVVRSFVIAHAVSGVDAGAYEWAAGGVAPIRRGSFRAEAGYLCLEQRLGGTGAATVFLMAGLDTLVGAYGARGYRLAQLAGGIAAGRIYLGAHAYGYGATGLTFYDDEVAGFFSPRATGTECMLVVAIGERGGRLLPLA